MSLYSVFEAVRGGLAAVLADLGETVPSHEIGEEFLPMPGPMPSIVWVPIGAGTIEAVAGPAAPTSRTDARGVSEARQAYSRNEVVHVYVRAADFQATERLLNHFVACARIQLTGFSFKPHSTRWGMAQAAGTKEPTQRTEKSGTEAVLQMSLKVPFTFERDLVVAGGTLTPVITGEILPQS